MFGYIKPCIDELKVKDFYKKTIVFTKENTTTVTRRGETFSFMAVNFHFDDITPGDAYSGMIHFTVHGRDYAFHPCAIYINYLPVEY